MEGKENNYIVAGIAAGINVSNSADITAYTNKIYNAFRLIAEQVETKENNAMLAQFININQGG
ncbi:hypothetical protein [Rhodopseudomonas parapalustris]